MRVANEVSTVEFCVCRVFDYVPQQDLMSNDLLLQFSKILKKVYNLNCKRLVLDFLVQGMHIYKDKSNVGINGWVLFLMVICYK